MRTCTLAFLIFLFLIACKQPAKETTPKVKAPTGLQLSAVVGGLSEPYEAYILTTLYNPTQDTLGFVTMNCSYEDYFVTDTVAFQVIPDHECNANYPTIKKVPPGCKIDQFIIVHRANDSTELKDAKFRIGMYNIKMEDTSPPDDPGLHLGEPPNKKFPIIWSNPIDMHRIYRKVYK